VKKVIFILSGIVILLTTSCSIKPKKIEYGKDACYYCKMNIVEKTHAAEIVTKKGKDFKYDAIECLLNDIEDRDRDKIALFLVTDYMTPEKLINAENATFLISKTIKSPMGANLSAFENKEDALTYIIEENGTIYNWSELQKHFYNK